MKQTAVEWLQNQIESISIQVFDGFITFIEFMEQREQLFKKAKEMEKQQIIESVVNTVKIGTEKEGVLFFTSEDEILIRNEAEQYYNETFKSE